MITIEQMVQREVLCCMSSLVSTLSSCQTGWNGETKNDLAELCEQASELAAPVLDYEEAATQAGWKSDISTGNTNWYNSNFVGSAAEAMHNDRQSHEGEARRYVDDVCAVYVSAEAVCNCESIDPYEWEVYEHWAVSQWLADKLIAQGERVDTDFAGLCIWGRTTTGQAIGMDGCIARIYADMMAPHTFNSVAPGA